MRAFDAADVVQENTGTATLSTPFTATVPSGVTEGNTGVVIMASQLPLAIPADWHPVAVANTLLWIFARIDLPAGESSWTFTPSTTANAAWTVREWGNVGGLETFVSATGSGGASSVSTGNTGSFTSQFVVGMLGVMLTSAGGSAWPTISYSDSFEETDSLQVGSGTASGDVKLWVARRYGTDSDAGPWSCTATFTGSMSSKTPFAALAVFRAQETEQATTGVVQVVGG